jgi:hypothetical protein
MLVKKDGRVTVWKCGKKNEKPVYGYTKKEKENWRDKK